MLMRVSGRLGDLAMGLRKSVANSAEEAVNRTTCLGSFEVLTHKPNSER